MRENEEYRSARLSEIRSPSVYLAAALGHFALLSKLRLARRLRAFGRFLSNVEKLQVETCKMRLQRMKQFGNERLGRFARVPDVGAEDRFSTRRSYRIRFVASLQVLLYFQSSL